MSRKDDIISDASLYSMMSVLTQIITLVAGILTRRFLGPVQTGIWSLLQIILVYSAYVPLGVTEATSREIPFYHGKGDYAKADEIKNVIYSFSTVMSALVAIGCVVYALFMHGSLRPELFYGLLMMGVLVMLQRSSNLHISFLRGYKLFSIAAVQMVLSAIVNALLVVFFTMRFKVYGFMVAMALSFVFNVAYIHFRHRFSFRWNFDFRRIWDLIQYGFPLILVSLLSTIFLTIDKLMIAKILGVEALGLYSVALLAYTYLHNLPNSIGIVLIPNFHQKFGETQNAEGLKGYLEKSTQVFEVIMPLLIATGWFFIPYFARLVLPDFEGSIPPMKYLITSVFWVALIHPYSYFLVVIRKQVLLLPIIGGACALAFLANLFSLTHGFGILGVGIATTFVYFCNFTATYFLACRWLYPAGVTWRRYVLLLFKYGLMVGALLLLNALFRGSEYSWASSLAQWVIFLLVYAPFLFKLNRDLNIFATLKKKYFNRFKVQEPMVEDE
ncbi:MAG: oligosaccharide flippase family protein [Candidatus Omnitrophota bacterium]|jgi:O-antigen/teichoic acid export membrane protein